MNILFVGAHHDDLELSIGGSVKRWSSEGHQVYSVILTTSEWKTPDGNTIGSVDRFVEQCNNAAALLGYTPYHFKLCSDFELRYDDAIVARLLQVIEQHAIDTLITIWPYDAHPTHQTASRIALAASRKIPRILTVKISWNSVPEAYNPKYFVDISDFVEIKLDALRCYQEEFERSGGAWEKYVRSSAQLHGLESNCEFAEAFEIVRYVY